MIVAILLALAATAQADRVAGEARFSVPLASAAARRADGRPRLEVAVWYPARAGAVATRMTVGPPGSPLFDIDDIAADAAPEAGRHPVILLSHGFGGSADDMGWLAAPLARAGYVVVSVDHPGNSALDKTPVGATAWWERPRDLIAALSAVTRDPRFGPLVDARRVGVAGFSMGGATALALAGARIDPMRFDAFCRANPADGVCQPPAEMPDTKVDVRKGIADLGLTEAAASAGMGTALPSVRAVLSISPNAQTLTPASLRRIRVPTVLVAGGRDRVVPIPRQAGYAAREIRRARLVTVPTAAHYSFMATCTEQGRVRIDVCRLAPDQAEAHRVAVAEALRLFRTALPPPARP